MEQDKVLSINERQSSYKSQGSDQGGYYKKEYYANRQNSSGYNKPYQSNYKGEWDTKPRPELQKGESYQSIGSDKPYKPRDNGSKNEERKQYDKKEVVYAVVLHLVFESLIDYRRSLAKQIFQSLKNQLVHR